MTDKNKNAIDFDKLITIFFKEQEEALAATLKKEKEEKLNKIITPNYFVDDKIKNNWENFQEKEKKEEQQRKQNKSGTAHGLSDDQLKALTKEEIRKFSLNSNIENIRKQMTVFFINQGHSLINAEEITKINIFLILNQEALITSEKKIREVCLDKSEHEIKKIIEQERLLRYKETVEVLSQDEIFELNKINSLKNNTKKFIKEIDFLKSKEAEKNKILIERIMLKRQYYAAQGYSSEKIDELIKKDYGK